MENLNDCFISKEEHYGFPTKYDKHIHKNYDRFYLIYMLDNVPLKCLTTPKYIQSTTVMKVVFDNISLYD